MKRDLVMTKPLKSSFLSCEKDSELILRKLFVESRPYNEDLIRLLTIPTKDCLESNDPRVIEAVKNTNVKKLMDQEYIRLNPKIRMREHEDVKSYIVLSFDNFTPSENPEFRNCTVHFDILCHTDYWDLGNYRQRPLKIAGYIDGILQNSKLSGIGTFQFAGCTETILNEELSGYSLQYWAIHGSDDEIPAETQFG